jgi:hypothetical protein
MEVGEVVVITVALSVVGMATGVVVVAVIAATPLAPLDGPGAAAPDTYWKLVSVLFVRPLLTTAKRAFPYGPESALV